MDRRNEHFYFECDVIVIPQKENSQLLFFIVSNFFYYSLLFLIKYVTYLNKT
jgi:hypothetical protein